MHPSSLYKFTGYKYSIVSPKTRKLWAKEERKLKLQTPTGKKNKLMGVGWRRHNDAC